MKRTYVLILVIIFHLNFSLSFAKKMNDPICSKEDRKYADFWGNYYVPEDAYWFGEKIKKIVRDKNLSGLYHLVEGELTTGPRKKFVSGKNFSDIFSNEWRKKLLQSKSPCSPVGWRGFMLNNGSIWFNKRGDKWVIISILGAKNEIINKQTIPVAWRFGERIIPPHCFSTLGMSRDNYEAFAEKFKIINIKDFSENPGVYFGREIPPTKIIKNSWGHEIYLASSIKKCFEGNLIYGDVQNIGSPEIKIKQKSVETRICSYKSDCIKLFYTILRKISPDECQSLAPNIKGKCLKAYLLSIGDYSGGTMGPNMSYSIYGLFNLQNNEKIIFPLKNFLKENNALNFLDTLSLIEHRP